MPRRGPPITPLVASALGLVLLAAVVLRFWRLGTGLPGYPSPDEPTLVGLAARIGAGDLNPHYFSYGTLWPYALTAGFGLFYALGKSLGGFASLAEFEAAYFTDPSRFFVVGRLMSATLGVATVGLVYALGRRLASPGVGLLAAATLALAPLHVEYSRYLLTDVPVTFAVALSTVLILRHVDRGATSTIWIPALAVGLATSVKYTALALAVPLVAAAWLRRSRAPVSRRLAAVAGAALGVLVGFVIGTPFALLDVRTFAGDLHARFWHGRYGHHGFGRGVDGFTVYATEVLPQGIGLVATVLGALGLAMLVRDGMRRGHVATALLALFVVPYALVIGFSATPFDRYVLPLVPFFCLAAAVAVGWIVLGLPEGLWRYVTGTVAAAALLLAPAVWSAGFIQDLDKPDTRDAAAEWIGANLPAGTVLATELYGPSLPTSREQLAARIARLEASDASDPEIARQLARWRRRYDAVAPGDGAAPSYVVYTLVLGSRIPDPAEVLYSLPQLRGLGVRYVILTSEMWERYARFPERYPEQVRFHRALRQEGRAVLELDAIRQACTIRFERLWALGMGEGWCRQSRGPALRVVELLAPAEALPPAAAESIIPR